MLKLRKNLIFIFCSIILSCCAKKDNSELIVGISADNPPYEFLEQEGIIGLDIDVITAISEDLGKQIRFKNLDFPSLIPALRSNTVDLIISGLNKTEEREKYLDFSDSYHNTKAALVFRKGYIQELGDMANKSVASQAGTTWETIAYKLDKTYNFKQIKFLNNNLTLIQELILDKIDIALMETAQAQIFTKKNPELAYLTFEEEISEFYIALPKGSKLREPINKAIDQLKSSGKLDSLKSKWDAYPENTSK